MRELVIPDIHTKHRVAQRLLESSQYDLATLLGDYFDDFGDTPEDNYATAQWLTSLPDRVTLLMGNHDIHYRYPDQACSGFTVEKAKAITDAMDKKTWDRMRVFHRVDDWLLSHAGFHPSLLKDADLEAQQIAFFDHMNSDRGWKMSKDMHASHPWLAVSYIRGGNQQIGGPFWQDWRQAKIATNVKQLFGHTPHFAPREHLADNAATDTGRIHCIDTHLQHYAIIEDGNLTIYKTPLEYFKP